MGPRDAVIILKERMKEKFDKKGSLLKDLKAVINIIITGKEKGCITVSIDGNDIAISEDEGDDADIVISIDSENLMKIINGKLSYKNAFFKGKLTIEGDFFLALKIISLMKD